MEGGRVKAEVGWRKEDGESGEGRGSQAQKESEWREFPEVRTKEREREERGKRADDGTVITIRRRGQINLLLPIRISRKRKELGEVLGSDPQRARSRDGLGGIDPLIRLKRRAEGQRGCCVCERL